MADKKEDLKEIIESIEDSRSKIEREEKKKKPTKKVVVPPTLQQAYENGWTVKVILEPQPFNGSTYTIDDIQKTHRGTFKCHLVEDDIYVELSPQHYVIEHK